MSLQPVRGTHDLLPLESKKHRFINDVALQIAESYGYQEIQTPIFEFSSVFSRNLGETSDIVTKEMYVFEDRGGDTLCLRPEGTASVVRAVISNGLVHQMPLKLFYAGPMFRYERPQKGRQRQFHQIGAELFGPQTPLADVETILLAQHILMALGLDDKIQLEVNTIGDQESRQAYRDVLVAYFQRYQNDLSHDSQQRLERNPLRILDSKDEKDKEIVKNAPSFKDHLNDFSKSFFQEFCDGLRRHGVNFIHNDRLVRGLDYYTHTVFEFTTQSLGAQGTVLSGGRYDYLVKSMGGPETPAVGFAAGVERLALMLDESLLPVEKVISIIPADPESIDFCFGLTQKLRYAGLSVDIGYSGNMSKRLKRADKVQSSVAIIIGQNEIDQNIALVRDLGNGNQQTIPFNHLIQFLESLA